MLVILDVVLEDELVFDVVVEVLLVVLVLDVIVDVLEVVEVVLEVVEVILEVVEVVLDVVEDVLLVVVGWVDATGVRYQLAGASPRHSPAVTPFQPLLLIKSK